MIDRDNELSIKRQAKLLGMSRTVAAEPKLHVFSRSERAFSSDSVFFQK